MAIDKERISSLLGCPVSDALTGFKGTVAAVAYYRFGNDRVNIVGKDGLSCWVDKGAVRLEEGNRIIPTYDNAIVDFDFGDMVRDVVTGYAGEVMIIAFWLFGTPQVTIQSPVLIDGKMAGEETFAFDRLKY